MATPEQLRVEPPPVEAVRSFDPVQPEPVAIYEVSGETRIGREKISLTYRAPVNPEDITDPVPLVIAHGWGGPELAYSNLGEEVAKMRKPSITYGEGRSLGLLCDLNPLHLLKVAQLSSKAAWAAMRYVRDEFGHSKFDAYGHSLGGETVVNVAHHKPDHVRTVIVDGSTGLDDHTLIEMIGRTGEFGKKELWPALGKIARGSDPRIGLHALHYIARHPARTLAEGLNAGSTNLHSRIERLGALGIGISAIQSPNDIYFPVEAVERHSRHLFGEHFHIRSDPESNHLAPQLDPLGTAHAIIQALDRHHPRASLELVPDMVV
jgi:pimeloyl-ACP methyl ester carboxylesterase